MNLPHIFTSARGRGAYYFEYFPILIVLFSNVFNTLYFVYMQRMGYNG
jgi:hypothetical protein